jgi:hypothetical protein
LSFLAYDGVEHALALMALLPVWGEVDHADAVLTGFGELKSEPFAGVLKKIMRNLEQDARAVPSAFFTAACATMIQVNENS